MLSFLALEKKNIEKCLLKVHFLMKILLLLEWKMMKNRKFMGKMEEQNIRSKQKPLIMDMER